MFEGKWKVRWQEWNDAYTKKQLIWVAMEYEDEDSARTKYGSPGVTAVGRVRLCKPDGTLEAGKGASPS